MKIRIVLLTGLMALVGNFPAFGQFGQPERIPAVNTAPRTYVAANPLTYSQVSRPQYVANNILGPPTVHCSEASIGNCQSVGCESTGGCEAVGGCTSTMGGHCKSCRHGLWRHRCHGHGHCVSACDLWATYCAEHDCCYHLPTTCSYDCCPPLWSARASALWLKPEGYLTNVTPILGDPGLGTVSINPDVQVGYEIAMSRAIGHGSDIAFRWFDVEWSNTFNRTVGATSGQYLADLQLSSFDLVYHSMWSEYFVPSVGFRYLDYDDLRRTTITVGNTTTFFAADVDNSMYGFQLGAEGHLWNGPVWTLDYLANAAILYNNMDALIAANSGGGVVGRSVSRNGEAFLGELELRSRIHITRHLSLISAYRAIWIDGLTSSTDVTAATIASVNASRDSTLFHGFDVGFELLW